jgi:phosphoglucosamine mutase
MTLRFGTDGVRGDVGRDLTPEFIHALGRASARVLGTERPLVVGRDTRQSGPMVEAALVAGLQAEGMSVSRAGVLPTPGVAYLAEAHDFTGAVISASHNPFTDNGVKLLARGGRKLTDAQEAEIEATLNALASNPRTYSGQLTPKRSVADPAADVDGYANHLVGALEGRRLDGLRVVIDCGHGAAFEIAPGVFEALGADLVVLNAEPDGTNINAGCGSTDPSGLQSAVHANGADAGLAFDGDADRVIAVDEIGELVDGDQLLAIAALDLQARGRLHGNAVVATVMSNLGLRRSLAAHGINVVETPVGDRNVLHALDDHGLSLGGEQSGHIIFADLATTGDGILTGLMLLDVLARTGRALSDHAAVVTKLPQVLRNVRVRDPGALETSASFWDDVRNAEAELGADGRVLVRPSGTEPVVRVMVEANTREQAEAIARRLGAAAEHAGGAG